MARGILASVLVLVSSGSPAFASTRLAIAMANDCGVPKHVVDVARKEATRIWSAAGVALRWTKTADLPYEASPADWLVVRCVPAEQRLLQPTSGRTLPIAAIRFLGGEPTNTVVLSVDNAKMLLARDGSEARNMNDRFALLKEIRLGRMLGRAIAHEVGHFLNQSEDHTPGGLMRASHTLAHLIGESLSHFKVDWQPVRSADAESAIAAERHTGTPAIRY